MCREMTERDGVVYLATAPALPGCASDGDTPEAALADVQDAIASWIEAAKEWKIKTPKPGTVLE